MRVGLAQMRPTLGDIERNIDLHLELIAEAKQNQVELLLFPELSVTGYNLLDLTYDVARSIHSESIKQLVSLADGIDIAFGFVETSQEHVLYNSFVYASNGEITYVHRKVYLPTYGMFDEGRYFGRGDTVRSFSTRFGQVGILICEDMWHPSAPFLLAQDRAQLILVPSNSPARSIDPTGLGSQSFWYTNLENQAILNGLFFLFCNRVGTEDGVTFFGGSSVVNPYGKHVAQAGNISKLLLITDIDLDEIRRARYETPLLRDENLDLSIRELSRIQQMRLARKEWI
jgi:predicted amidohydrolase